jgi:hypothetical protein
MTSTQLLQRIQQQHNQECELLNLADTMVANATSMQAQGYEQLLQTRQQFKEKLHEALTAPLSREMPFAY